MYLVTSQWNVTTTMFVLITAQIAFDFTNQNFCARTWFMWMNKNSGSGNEGIQLHSQCTAIHIHTYIFPKNWTHKQQQEEELKKPTRRNGYRHRSGQTRWDSLENWITLFWNGTNMGSDRTTTHRPSQQRAKFPKSFQSDILLTKRQQQAACITK